MKFKFSPNLSLIRTLRPIALWFVLITVASIAIIANNEARTSTVDQVPASSVSGIQKNTGGPVDHSLLVASDTYIEQDPSFLH